MEGTSALQYHAYVAYNDDARCDEDWVPNDLQPHMEEGPDPCYLCIKSRDFTPGHPLIENYQRKDPAEWQDHFSFDSTVC